MIQDLVRAGDPSPYHQPNQLFRNLDGAGFEDVSQKAGDVFSRSESSRGLALGDLDNDGDMDAVLTNNGGPARVLENRVGSAANWIGLRLLDGSTRDGKTDAVGATAVLRIKGSDRQLLRSVRTAGQLRLVRMTLGSSSASVGRHPGADISALVTLARGAAASCGRICPREPTPSYDEAPGLR